MDKDEGVALVQMTPPMQRARFELLYRNLSGFSSSL